MFLFPREPCALTLFSFREAWSLFQLLLLKYAHKSLMIINYLSHKPFLLFSLLLVLRVVECSCWCVISNNPRVSISVCHIRSSHLGVSGSLSAASCVTIRSTNLEELDSLICSCKELSHTNQRSNLGTYYLVSEHLWLGKFSFLSCVDSIYSSSCSDFDRSVLFICFSIDLFFVSR